MNPNPARTGKQFILRDETDRIECVFYEIVSFHFLINQLRHLFIWQGNIRCLTVGHPSKDFPFSLMIITSIKMSTATIKCGQKQSTNPPPLLYCLNEDRRQKGTPTGHCRYSPTFFLYSSYFYLTQQQFLITTIQT